ncbi:MAG: hypothetical protein AAF333_16955 [Planctomycetota bacterium]
MRIVEDALRQEATRTLTTDAARDRQYLESARRNLEDAYRADLDAVPVLTPDWVESATSAYVAAREGLLRHELDLADQRRGRAENLRAAAAQSRAIALLERQDQLLGRFGVDLWRLTQPEPEPRP